MQFFVLCGISRRAHHRLWGGTALWARGTARGARKAGLRLRAAPEGEDEV